LAIAVGNPDYAVGTLLGIVIATWISFAAINFSIAFKATRRLPTAATKSADPESAPAGKTPAPKLANAAWALTGIPVVLAMAYFGVGKPRGQAKVEPPAAPQAAVAPAPAPIPAPQAIVEPAAIAKIEPIPQPASSTSSAPVKKKSRVQLKLAEAPRPANLQPPPDYAKAAETIQLNFPGIDQNSQEYRWRVEKEILKQGNR
jgi:outer membrane biosynthesis protein TonB